MMTTKEILNAYAFAFKEKNYPPVIGKVLGAFFVSDQRYLTFEEIMEITDTSKSAMSKSLKVLIDHGEIDFEFSKTGKNRRLFYLDIDGFTKRLDVTASNYSSLNDILRKTLKIRSSENKSMNEFIERYIYFNEMMVEFLERKRKITFNH